MPRAKGGFKTRRKHKKIIKLAKGYYGQKKNVFRRAKEQVEHSLQYSYVGRKLRKRDFRRLWIVRINAICRANNIKYSEFIGGLKKSGVEINRKMLAHIAYSNPEAFKRLIKIARGE